MHADPEDPDDSDITMEVMAVIHIHKPPKKARRIAILNELLQEITMDTISSGKKRTYTAQAVDQNGNPAPVDGFYNWQLGEPGGVSLVPSSNTTTCDVLWMEPKTGITL